MFCLLVNRCWGEETEAKDEIILIRDGNRGDMNWMWWVGGLCCRVAGGKRGHEWCHVGMSATSCIYV